jgi:hypothetical protein
VTDRHTAVDYAHVLKELSDTRFPDAEKVILVQDNLNTHTPASLYEAFPANEARRLVERFKWHYTPKHGSWLNLAESELGVLGPNASIGGCPTNGSSRARSLLATATRNTPRPTGELSRGMLKKKERRCSP